MQARSSASALGLGVAARDVARIPAISESRQA